MIRFDILTSYPDFFNSPLKTGILSKALQKGIVTVAVHDIRDYAFDRHRRIDDAPYGGGPGMVMKAVPVVEAIESVRQRAPDNCVVLLTPQGERLSQDKLSCFSRLSGMTVVCGRYEGIDERIREFADVEISAGDYILMGGEIPALLIIEGVSRLIPGVLGNGQSIDEESFSNGLLEYPHYTRPSLIRGFSVPDVLLSGDHARIRSWRERKRLQRTLERRPDLLEQRHNLTTENISRTKLKEVPLNP